MLQADLSRSAPKAPVSHARSSRASAGNGAFANRTDRQRAGADRRFRRIDGPSRPIAGSRRTDHGRPTPGGAAPAGRISELRPDRPRARRSWVYLAKGADQGAAPASEVRPARRSVAEGRTHHSGAARGSSRASAGDTAAAGADARPPRVGAGNG